MNDLTEISLFKDRLSTTPIQDITLTHFYGEVINGKYKREIDFIRANPEKAKSLKERLQCVTISGTFSERKITGLIKHSGRICIDIDAKVNSCIDSWPRLRDTLGTWKEVEFAALSASGNGLLLVIKISNPEKHLYHFQAIQNAFTEHGIMIDKACCDVSRLRFMTFDKDAIINENVTPHLFVPHKTTFKKAVFKGKHNNLDNLVNEIENLGLDITCSYKQWYEIGCAIANEVGDGGRNYYHRLSRYHPKYNQKECDMQYDKCLKDPKGFTIRTIFYYRKLLI
jgi:hypothetical protein